MGSLQRDIQGNRTMKRVKNLATLAQSFHTQCFTLSLSGLLTTKLLPLSAALQARGAIHIT